MADIGSQCQGSPLAQDIDLSCASELQVPGSFPVTVPTMRGCTSTLNTSLPTDHGDGVTSTLQDMNRFEYATEYFIALAIQRLLNLIACPRHIVLALHKIRNELSNIWSNLSKFALVERNPLTTGVVM